MKNRTGRIGLVLALALGAPALAADAGGTLLLQGFGTLGGVHSSNRDADYVANYYFQPNGAGRDSPTAFSVDTKLGLQLTWTPTTDLSMVTQVLVKQTERDNWTPQLEWAFLKYRISPELEMRAGRIRPPVRALQREPQPRSSCDQWSSGPAVGTFNRLPRA